jgi:GWxTD domain-containing protein
VKNGRAVCTALLLLGALALARPSQTLAAPAADPAPAALARADSLCRSARARLASASIDQRRLALRDLEEAALLAPDDAAIALSLADACLVSGFTTRARGCYERAARLAPQAAAPRRGLGLCWKRDWLEYLEPSSLTRAIDHVRTATRLDSASCDAWLTLAPLLYEQGDRITALDAARRAHGANPDRAEAEVALAYLEYRDGSVARADSLFKRAIPALPPALSSRFIDLAPLLSAAEYEGYADLPPEGQREYERRFWSEADPDPTTPENETRLEYWARVAHATLLYLDPHEPRWDVRAELYVRYGAPGHTNYEPVGYASGSLMAGMWFPYHLQVLTYPDLGVTVQLRDVALTQRYELPRATAGSPEPRPDPRALARSDLLATAGGRAVFPVLPPGIKPLHMEGFIASFEGEEYVKLLAQVEAPGTPEDSIWAQCVVTDANERQVARAGRALSPSACDPTVLRTGDFSFELPPGDYRLAFSVRNANGARGVTRISQHVESAPASLAMSDVVVA